jgi:hypothetical protein
MRTGLPQGILTEAALLTNNKFVVSKLSDSLIEHQNFNPSSP